MPTKATCNDCQIHATDVRIRQSDYLLCDNCELVRNPPRQITDTPQRKHQTKKPAQTEKATTSSTSTTDSSKSTRQSTDTNQKRAMDSAIPLSLKEATAVILEAHKDKVDQMNVQELSDFNALDLLPPIRDDIRNISPTSDLTEVANESFQIVTYLSEYAASCLASKREARLTFSPRAIADKILAQSPLRKQSNTKVDKAQPIVHLQSERKVQCISESCGKRGSETVDCSLCGHFYHRSCVGMKGRKPATWFCLFCRRMPGTMNELKSKVQELESTCAKQQHLITEQSAKIISLESAVNTMSASRPTTLTSLSSTQTDRNQEPATEQQCTKEKQPKTLIIGDSIIRDLNENGLHNTTVECLRGKKVKNIHDKLKELPIEDFSTVIIHGSTNDCTSVVGVQLAEDVYGDIVSDINSRAPNSVIGISTICPRMDNKNHQENVDKLNDKLRNLANGNGCLLIDNDDNFRLRNNSPDESTLNNDKIHLSASGTKRLLKNINERHMIIKKQTTNMKRQQHPQTPHRQAQWTKVHYPRKSHPRNNRQVNQANFTGCYFCGELNHTKQNCRYGQPLICYGCNAPGHKKQACPLSRYNN